MIIIQILRDREGKRQEKKSLVDFEVLMSVKKTSLLRPDFFRWLHQLWKAYEQFSYCWQLFSGSYRKAFGGSPLSRSHNQVYNLQSPVQNENVGSLFRALQDSDSRALNKARVLLNVDPCATHRSHTVKLVLIGAHKENCFLGYIGSEQSYIILVGKPHIFFPVPF